MILNQVITVIVAAAAAVAGIAEIAEIAEIAIIVPRGRIEDPPAPKSRFLVPHPP